MHLTLLVTLQCVHTTKYQKYSGIVFICVLIETWIYYDTYYNKLYTYLMIIIINKLFTDLGNAKQALHFCK